MHLSSSTDRRSLGIHYPGNLAGWRALGPVKDLVSKKGRGTRDSRWLRAHAAHGHLQLQAQEDRHSFLTSPGTACDADMHAGKTSIPKDKNKEKRFKKTKWRTTQNNRLLVSTGPCAGRLKQAPIHIWCVGEHCSVSSCLSSTAWTSL